MFMLRPAVLSHRLSRHVLDRPVWCKSPLAPTSAPVSNFSDNSDPAPWCRSVLGPNCLGSEVYVHHHLYTEGLWSLRVSMYIMYDICTHKNDSCTTFYLKIYVNNTDHSLQTNIDKQHTKKVHKIGQSMLNLNLMHQ